MTAVLVFKVRGFFFIPEKGLLATQYKVFFLCIIFLVLRNQLGIKKRTRKKINKLQLVFFPIFAKKQNALRKGVFKLVFDWLGQISLKVIL